MKTKHAAILGIGAVIMIVAIVVAIYVFKRPSPEDSESSQSSQSPPPLQHRVASPPQSHTLHGIDPHTTSQHGITPLSDTHASQHSHASVTPLNSEGMSPIEEDEGFTPLDDSHEQSREYVNVPKSVRHRNRVRTVTDAQGSQAQLHYDDGTQGTHPKTVSEPKGEYKQLGITYGMQQIQTDE